MALPVAAGFTGRVVSSAGGGPVANQTLFVYDATGRSVNGATTDDGGRYVVRGLEGGEYRLCSPYDNLFNAASPGGFLAACYRNAPPPNGSTGHPPANATVIATSVGTMTDVVGFRCLPPRRSPGWSGRPRAAPVSNS